MITLYDVFAWFGYFVFCCLICFGPSLIEDEQEDKFTFFNVHEVDGKLCLFENNDDEFKTF